MLLSDCRRLENDDDLVAAGQGELLAGEALQGAGVVLDGIDRGAEVLADSFLLLDLRVENKHLLAEALVLFDQREIPHENSEQTSEKQEEDDQAAEFVPDPEVDLHWHRNKPVCFCEEKKNLNYLEIRQSEQIGCQANSGGVHTLRDMIKALLLLLDPTNTWEKITQNPPGVTRVLFTYLLPLILLGTAVETWGLIKLGRDEGAFTERRIKVPQEVALRYAVVQAGSAIVIAFVGAWIFKAIGEGFHRRQPYTDAFATLGYSVGPYYLTRMLDGAPFMNTWICWAIGAALVVSVLYRGVPRLMRPDPSNALGVYLLCSFLLVAILAVSHFVAVLVLDEKILTQFRIPLQL
jgi:hypothetical protein